MNSKSYRLDRFIHKHTDFSLSDTRLLIAKKRILIDGKFAETANQRVGDFTHLVLDGVCLNNKTPLYLKLNKPKGVVSATVDAKHRTVLDLISHPRKSELHIAGRLDLNTTGLVLLTNDGAWSRTLSLPATKCRKTYEVTTAKPITQAYVDAFQEGMYFAYEDITTQAAKLEILSETRALLSITEGKYHQIKRMFGAFRNEVLGLHRITVGNVGLGNLAPGESGALSSEEIESVSV